MSRRHRIRYLDAGGRYVCNARFCKFTTAPALARSTQLTIALRHVTTENKGTLAPVEEPASVTAG